MLTIETKKLEISDELKRKVEMICRFANQIYKKSWCKKVMSKET